MRARGEREVLVVTCEPNAVTPELVATAAAVSVEALAVTISEAARGARVVARHPRVASGRPG